MRTAAGKEGRAKRPDILKLIDKLYHKSQERFGDNAFGETVYDLKTDIEAMKGKWHWQIIGSVIGAIMMSGIAMQLIRGIFGLQEAVVITKIPSYGLGTGLPVTVILFVIINYLCYYARKSIGKGYTHVSDGNYEISEKGTYGTAREMTDAEKKAVFYGAPIEDNVWTILGADRINEKILYSMKHLHDKAIGVDNYAAINPHIAVIGSSQSGKTYSVILPTIMQAIRRGESVITTSPKGELYEYTANLARKNGYTVKVINLNPDQLANSDSINFLKYAIKNPTDEDEVVKDVISFSRTIIDNTRSEGDKVEKFFEDCAFSLLQSIILYLVLSDDIPEEEKTLGNVYMKLSEWGVAGLLTHIGHLPISHPAKRTFRTFMDSSDTVRQSSVSGLQLKLQILSAKKVRRITDYDTVSLTAPGQEKCIYYIGMSVDEKNTLKFLVSLYFSIQFQALIKLAKSEYAREGEKLPVKVNFILDEFANCGIIPDMTDKLSVVRSYNIDIMIALQDINQLQSMYPLNDQWQTILSQCMTQIVLKTNDPVTEEFFSIKSGEMTVVAKNDRYQEGRADLLKMHPYTYKTESSNKRYALTPDEVRRLAPNELLVFVSGYNYIKLHKFGMDRHPMYQEIERCYIMDYRPGEDGGTATSGGATTSGGAGGATTAAMMDVANATIGQTAAATPGRKAAANHTGSVVVPVKGRTYTRVGQESVHVRKRSLMDPFGSVKKKEGQEAAGQESTEEELPFHSPLEDAAQKDVAGTKETAAAVSDTAVQDMVVQDMAAQEAPVKETPAQEKAADPAADPFKATKQHRYKKKQADLPVYDGPAFGLDEFQEYTPRKEERDEQASQALDGAFYR